MALYDREFQKVNGVADFLVSDEVGWDAAGCVEAGAGGTFYGLDQHRDRILQISPQGKVVKAYALPHFDKISAQAFRVSEKAQTFYVLYWTKPQLVCVGFDGKVRWERILGVGSNTYEGDNGGFDVDDNGTLYVIGSGDNVLRKIGSDGKPIGEVKLAIPAERKPAEGIHGLRIWKGDVVLRGRHPSELFQVYDLATGAFRRSVSIDHERLTATLQGGAWTAGQSVDFQIHFDGGGRQIGRAGASGLGLSEFWTTAS